ncbi:ion channel [Nonomuraea sp. NPDC050310]|uniref:potassium channel family protein n=1 Tax=Nonomuraea sp. NPDC050310 TaxID=3154935 RepID=UPI0033DAEBA3
MRRAVRIWGRALAATVLVLGLYFFTPLPGGGESATGPVRWVVLGASVAGLVSLVGFQVRRALGAGGLAEQIAMLLTLVQVVAAGFAALYFTLADQFDGIETRLDALYFSVVTLCTVGFGDIIPMGQAARAVVSVQMIFDLVIVTTGISIVVNAFRRPVARN